MEKTIGMTEGIKTKLFFLLLSISIVWPAANINWSERYIDSLLGADAKGYYAYLPAVFIYQDLNFGFFKETEQEKYYNPNLYFDYRVETESGVTNKYFLGTAILEMPFFLIAHVLTHFTDYDQDGFSPPYLFMMSVSGLIYALLGLFLVFRTLKQLNIDFWGIVVTLVVMLHATNLFYYTVSEPGMSHVYSFFLIATFCYVLVCHSMDKIKTAFWLGGLLGLITVVRPVNLMVVLAAPFLWSISGQAVDFKAIVYKRLWGVMLVFLLVCDLVPVVYFVQTGKFWVYSYGAETLNFLDPYFISFLFSFKKGLFLYTPVLALVFVAVMFSKRLTMLQKGLWGLFNLIVWYVLSSWEIWWYGGSFGQRPFIEFYPIYFIAFAMVVSGVKNWLPLKKFAILGLLFLFVSLNHLKNYQYRYNIIHWDGMDRSSYFELFFELP